MTTAYAATASPSIHVVPTDPGLDWVKDADVAVDAPPDSDIDPAPETQWPTDGDRTGMCGVVGPRVSVLPEGGYRLYYSQMLPRPGFPAGANDYDNATTRILSARSEDGSTWIPEPGIRLTPQAGGAGNFRVVSSDVVPAGDGSGRLRMYYECCPGPQSQPNSIRSAISQDGGLKWQVEEGARFESAGRHYSSPRLFFLEDGRCRLYCCQRGKGIISALSEDGGLTFRQDPGIRIAPDRSYDQQVAFASEMVRIKDGGYRMYYAGYSAPNRAYILSAVSEDGLEWQKEPEPVVSPGGGNWDAAKCSEMCLIYLPPRDGEAPRYRLLYEACDGTAVNERGVWRIASATSVN